MTHIVRGGLRVRVHGKAVHLPLRGKNMNLFRVNDTIAGQFLESWVIGPTTPSNLTPTTLLGEVAESSVQTGSGANWIVAASQRFLG